MKEKEERIKKLVREGYAQIAKNDGPVAVQE